LNFQIAGVTLEFPQEGASEMLVMSFMFFPQQTPLVKRLLGFFVVPACTCLLLAAWLGVPPPGADAIELSKHPWFQGQISPRQAERLIHATMTLNSDFPVIRFNSRGEYHIYPKEYHKENPPDPNSSLPPKLERIRQNPKMWWHSTMDDLNPNMDPSANEVRGVTYHYQIKDEIPNYHSAMKLIVRAIERSD
jgi:hypothetical protein